MAQIETNGITIEYEIEGTGDPLLLVMGLGGQLTDWSDDWVQHLVDLGFQVIRFDNRDIGLSTEFDHIAPPTTRELAQGLVRRSRGIRAAYRLSDMADDAVGLLDQLGIDSAHVCGISMGGMIAQTMAIHHPERVRSLTSIMSNTGDRTNGGIHPKVLSVMARRKPVARADAAEESVNMFRLWSGSSWDPELHRARAERSVARSYRPAGTARQNAAILASPDRTAALARVSAPTLVIHGLQDRLVRPSGGTATAKAVPGSRLLMFPDMGHDLPPNRFGECAHAIRQNADRAPMPSDARSLS